MTKKRQVDFHKTKLKPGKILPRGRNVFNTAIKTKKIIMPTQARKEKSQLTIQECMRRASHAGPVNSREDALKQLNNLLIKEENLSVYLSDMFETLSKTLLDDEESLRHASVKVLETILERTDSIKISTSLPLLMKILSCTMTHMDLKVKKISLNLLSIFLKTHPHLLCTSFTILTDLIGLLSGQFYNTKSRRAVQKNNLLVSCGDSFYSQDWRIQVLAHMSMFLKVVLENLRPDIDESDDTLNEVHWDGKSPLFIEIFAGGGLKPVDIEKTTASFLKPKVVGNNFENPNKVQLFMTDIMEVLLQIFIEEITDGTSKSDDDLVLKENINNLSILFQVMCYLGEWVKLIYDEDSYMEKSFSKDLNDKFFRIMKFPFVARGPVFNSKSHGQHQHLPCVRLNLSVCYLHSAFLLKLKPDSSVDNLKNQYLNYIKGVCRMSPDIKYDSIPTLLKIVKIYLPLTKASKDVYFMQNILNDMCRILKIKDARPNVQLLISFFVELSLEIGDKYLMNFDIWFTQLLDLLQKMCDSGKIDRKFLKNIRRISVRKHPLFLDSLEKMSISTFKDMLTHANEDVSETAIFLIYNMREVSNEFLLQLSNLILTHSGFPQEKAFKLIRLLTHRFSDPSIPAADRINFTTFLLNTALDTVNLEDDRWANHDNTEFTSIWAQFHAEITIHPSLHWKKHSKLFEVCQKSLQRFPSYTVNKIAVSIINEIMFQGNRKELPVHSVIAILTLNNPAMMNGGNEKHMHAMLQDIVNSVLMFLSVMSSLAIDKEWYECNVISLMNCLPLNRDTVRDFFQQLEYDSQVSKSGIAIYYVLRVIKFLIESNLFFREDSSNMLSYLEDYKKNCTKTDISQQPLYNELYNYFMSFNNYF